MKGMYLLGTGHETQSLREAGMLAHHGDLETWQQRRLALEPEVFQPEAHHPVQLNIRLGQPPVHRVGHFAS